MCEEWDVRDHVAAIEYHRATIYDTDTECLPLAHTNALLSRIHRDEKKTVLVHCIAGRNRSLATIVGYLRFLRGWTLDEVRKHFENIPLKPLSTISANFMRQLEEWHPDTPQCT